MLTLTPVEVIVKVVLGDEKRGERGKARGERAGMGQTVSIELGQYGTDEGWQRENLEAYRLSFANLSDFRCAKQTPNFVSEKLGPHQIRI